MVSTEATRGGTKFSCKNRILRASIGAGAADRLILDERIFGENGGCAYDEDFDQENDTDRFGVFRGAVFAIVPSLMLWWAIFASLRGFLGFVSRLLRVNFY